MAYVDIVSRLTGWTTKLPRSEAYNIVEQAWGKVRDERLWSFQLVEDSFTTPDVIQAGTFTCTQGLNTITADATASAAVTGVVNPLVTQRQFRIAQGTIYSIVGADFSVPTAVVLTLDRLFTDPGGSGLNYQIYQAYVPAPYQDWKRWIDWRDITNGDWLDIYKTRREIDILDPQRLYFTFPKYILPYGPDLRPGTSTPGWPLYEMYPNPLSEVSYMRWGIRRGASLVKDEDELPLPITDDLVFSRSRMLAYEWQEANRDPSVPRSQNADSKFLYQSAAADYTQELRRIGLGDRDRIDLYLSRIPRHDVLKQPYYSSITGRAYSGA